MKSISLNTRLVIGIILLLCAVAMVSVIRGKPHNSLLTDPNGGSVTVTATYADSQMVADNLALHNTFTDKESYTFDRLASMPHQFAVTKSGYWPWAKTITPAPHTSTTLTSFSILIAPKRDDIAKDSDAHKAYQKQFASIAVPSSVSVLRSEDGSMAVWAADNSIFAEWIGDQTKIPYYFCKTGVCNSRIVVLASRYNIRSLAFLPGHDDVVVFANDTSINAIELNRDDIQNFQPIYQSVLPQFILDGDFGMIIDSQDTMFHLAF